MVIPYEAEIERLAAEVEAGADLYKLAYESEYARDETLFRDAMDSTMFPDAYINLVRGRRLNMDERTKWMLLAPTVVFFAMCADVRWCVAERAEVKHNERQPVRVHRLRRRRKTARLKGIDKDEN